MKNLYLKPAFRSLWKNKGTTAINTSGLGVGLAVCMLILLYVSHELSFDRCHEKSGRIFSTIMNLKMGENDLRMNLFTRDLAAQVKTANPEVQESLRFTGTMRDMPIIKSEEGRQFQEERFFYADPSIFRVFTFHFKEGNPASALEAPDAVCISAPVARKYFGEASALGKTLTVNGKDLLRVTGVFEKMPANSTLQFDLIASLPLYEQQMRRDHPEQNPDAATSFQTWFLLDDAASKEKVQSTIAGFNTASDDPVFGKAVYQLSPLESMHLGENWGDFSNTRYICIFLAAAALVLFLALFNYMNLTTARASSRMREVGVRKALGARREQIAGQFYGESLLVSAMGFATGLAIFGAALPSFYRLLDLKIDAAYLYSPVFIGVMAALFILSALLAGSYPALLLSRFSPVRVLKGERDGVAHGAWVRKTLMVTQFAVSIMLVAAALCIRSQVSYMQNRNIGMNKEQVMVLPLTKNLGRHYPAFREAVAGQTGVRNVSAASFAFFRGGWDMWFVKTPETGEDVGISALMVDEHFFETLQIGWETAPAAPKNLAVKKQLLLNKSGISKLKISTDPVGKQIEMQDGFHEIAGITRDFNFVGLQQPIDGMLMAVVPDTTSLAGRGGQLYVRFDPSGGMEDRVAAIQRVYRQFEPEIPFDYYFLDEAFNSQYRAERRMGYLFSGFAGVAVFLACLGLFGLAAFAAERRSKEIGIRKVLGATVTGITGMLAFDFVKPVLLSFVLAMPVTYYFMQRWLADFAYRIDIGWWIFALSGALALCVALLTVGFQSLRAALANPVLSLRSE